MAYSRRSLGERLGDYCVRLKITATDISILLNVSRPTLSSWFDGTTSPTQDTHIHKVKILLAILNRAENNQGRSL